MRKISAVLMSLLILSTIGCAGGNAEAQSIRERIAERRAQQDGRGLRNRRDQRPPAQAEPGELVHNGLTRTYFYQAAPGPGRSAQSGAAKPPLILALHGGTLDAGSWWQRGELPQVAREAGAILVAPNAVGGNWNDGRTIFTSGSDPTKIDDVGFLSALIDEMVAKRGADPQRVYLIGPSNGGNMTWRMACERGDKIAAIAPVISTMLAGPETYCAAARPMPVIAFFGTEDQLMRYDGASVPTRDGRQSEPRLAAPATTDFWARVNGCGLEPSRADLPDVEPADATRVARYAYDCRKGAEVVRYDVIGGGHLMPGTPTPRIEALANLLGRGNQDISAEALAVAFFLKHSG